MAALPKLSPIIRTLDARRLPVLDTKAGSTPRERGSAWTAKRQKIALAHGYRCVDCQCVWVSSRDHIDHDTPLEQGGSNEDSNLKPRCITCHAEKTRAEAQARAGFA